MAGLHVKIFMMKNKVLLSLVVSILVCTGIVAYSVHHHAKASVSEQFNTDSYQEKEKTPKNEMMLWESLSSHLLSLN